MAETSAPRDSSRSMRRAIPARRFRRPAALALAAIAALLAVSACSGIPSSGSVQSQIAVDAPDDSDVLLLPSGPFPGASQTQILNGFLQAAASPQSDYQVARSFLSSSFSKQWDPNAGVLIDSGQQSLQETADNAISVGFTPIAEVDATGEYAESTSSAAVTLPFQFTEEDGQWRISLANSGIILPQSQFDRVFSSHALYFYDPSYTYLVPDIRWFAKDQTTSTRVVKALLAGPAPWLGQGAVVTAFPDGTETTSVVVTSGQANVPLSTQVLTQSQETLQRMQNQLEASLVSTVASVASVSVTVNQNPVTITAGAAPIFSPQIDQRALVLQSGVFGFISGGQVAPISSLSDKVEALSPTSVTTSSKVSAVGTAAGVYAVQPGPNEPVLVDARAGLIPPSLDPAGYVWSVPASAPSSIQAYGSDGAVHDVDATWDGATGITSLEVSRDGTRVLAFTTTDGQPSLIVAAILRDKDGVPLRLGNPIVLATGAGAPVDATWADQSTVVSLTLTEGGAASAVSQQIGGTSTALATPTAGVALIGSNDTSGLWLLTRDGDLQQQRASGWQTTASGISFVATQT